MFEVNACFSVSTANFEQVNVAYIFLVFWFKEKNFFDKIISVSSLISDFGWII